MAIYSSSSLFHLRTGVCRWVRHYMYFTKPALFLAGLVFAHGLVKNAVVEVMMSYLTESWETASIMKAAAIINIGEGISGVIAIITSILTDAWLGRFKMVLFTTASFILGLMLLWLSTNSWFPIERKSTIFYVALLLIKFGTAGKDPPFKNFFEDQLIKKEEGDEQVFDGSTFWWGVWKFIGAAISVFFIAHMPWDKIFLLSASLMAAAYVMLLVGIFWPNYNYTPATETPFFLLFKVVRAAFTKRALDYPLTPSGYYCDQPIQGRRFPRKSFLRCIDKAAIVEPASPSQPVGAESQNENHCTVLEVVQAKSFLRLIPLWFAFILYGVVTAAGTTFFIEQCSGLQQYIGSNFKVLVNFLFIMRRLVSYIISFLANLILQRYCSEPETRKLKGGLIRVGIGIGVSIVCCGVASYIEHHRLHLIDIYGDPDDDEKVSLPMSILVLAPQFIFLGLMDGLSEDGLSELFYILVDKSMEGIETPTNELMLGIGQAVSVGFVYIFERWFGDTINTSRLDKYFLVLMFLSAGNLLFYAVIGYYYVHVQKRETQSEIDHPQQEGAED